MQIARYGITNLLFDELTHLSTIPHPTCEKSFSPHNYNDNMEINWIMHY